MLGHMKKSQAAVHSDQPSTNKSSKKASSRNTVARLRPSKRQLTAGLLVLIGLFLLFNLSLYAAFRQRAYPNTRLNNQSIGAIHFNSIESKATSVNSNLQNVTLQAGQKEYKTNLNELGIAIDTSQLMNNVKDRHWLPAINLFREKNIELDYTTDTSKFDSTINAAAEHLHVPPSNAKIVLADDAFSITAGSAGQTVDNNLAQETILRSIKQNNPTVTLPTLQQDPDITTKSLQEETDSLNSMLTTKISIVFADKKHSVSRQELISLFTEQDGSYTLSKVAASRLIDSFANRFGITAGNKTAASNNLIKAVQSKEPATVELTEQKVARRSYTYCVAAKGVSSSYLGAFRSKLQAVYADERGWGLGGSIIFKEVSSGCSFTAWLTKAELVPSFSSVICDSTWSCRVGNNVIINFDRWSNASPAWNAAGGDLDEYRSMVINHETGHWLGFRHRYCGGAGQPAPVMQQQSINLQGCRFNAWPTESEKNSL